MTLSDKIRKLKLPKSIKLSDCNGNGKVDSNGNNLFDLNGNNFFDFNGNSKTEFKNK